MARYRRNQAQGVAAPRFNPHLFYATASRVVEMRSRRAYRPVHAGRPRHLSRLPSNRASSLRGSGDTSAASRRNQHHARSYIDLMWRSREGLHIKREHQDRYASSGQSDFHEFLPLNYMQAHKPILRWRIDNGKSGHCRFPTRPAPVSAEPRGGRTAN